jgi:threonine synthase
VSTRYACADCGAEFATDAVVYRCPRCETAPPAGGFARGILSVVFDPARLGARLQGGAPLDPHAFLPIPVPGPRAFTAGGTPLVEPARLREATGFPNLFLKNDTLNPTGSLKDRASLLVAAQAIAAGERRVALASTGNAGASMAGAGAALGLEVVLFVPGSAPRAKLLQSLLYGAKVVPVRGTYDDAFGLSIEYTKARGGVNRNTAWNPFTIEGKKTVSLEIWNQLGGRVPDVVYVPTGDGVIIAGVHKGFADLVAAGLAERLPVLVAVQASGSNAIAASFREGREVTLAGTSTIADSLAVSSPANGRMALRCLAATGGRAVEVDDAAISRAQLELCRASGLFVEPSSAAAWAGFLADRANVDRRSTAVVILTGTGFKDVKAAERLAAMPAPCEPRLDPALELLEREYGRPRG